jgi:hypothetical protein
VIERRQAERESLVQNEGIEGQGSPMSLIQDLEQVGNPFNNDREMEPWLTPETLADVRLMWSSTAAGGLENHTPPDCARDANAARLPPNPPTVYPRRNLCRHD